MNDVEVECIKIYALCYLDHAKSPLHGYKSWDYCYTYFSRNLCYTSFDIEKAALLLTDYLSCFGMRKRESAYLTDKNHQIFTRLLCELTHDINNREFYDTPIKPSKDEKAKYIAKIEGLFCKILHSLENIFERKLSGPDTLVTKIMLGIFGCTPALDTNVKAAMKRFKVKSENRKALLTHCWSYYFFNQDEFEKMDYIIEGTNIKYPPMRLLDMALFMLGKECKSQLTTKKQSSA